MAEIKRSVWHMAGQPVGALYHTSDFSGEGVFVPASEEFGKPVKFPAIIAFLFGSCETDHVDDTIEEELKQKMAMIDSPTPEPPKPGEKPLSYFTIRAVERDGGGAVVEAQEWADRDRLRSGVMEGLLGVSPRFLEDMPGANPSVYPDELNGTLIIEGRVIKPNVEVKITACEF